MDAYGVLRDSAGPVAAVAILVVLILSAVASTLLVAGALFHLAGVMRRHCRSALIGGSAITASWIMLALVGAHVVPGEPIAAADTISTAVAKASQVSLPRPSKRSLTKLARPTPMPACRRLTCLPV